MQVLVFGIHGVTEDIYTFGRALVLYFKSHVDFHVPFEVLCIPHLLMLYRVTVSIGLVPNSHELVCFYSNMISYHWYRHDGTSF